MKKNLALVFLLCVFTASAAQAQGGATTGGDGGHGVFCRKPFKDSSGSLFADRLAVLDLYEAQALHENYRWPSSDAPIEISFDQFGAVAKQAYKVLAIKRKRLERQIGHIDFFTKAFKQAGTLITKSRMRDNLPRTLDQGPLLFEIPPNCEIVQIGFFVRGTGEVWIDRIGAAYLDSTQLSALVLHEALHAQFKKETSTLPIRKMVAYIFGDSNFQRDTRDSFLTLVKSQRSE